MSKVRRSFWDYSAKEFHDYITSLYDDSYSRGKQEAKAESEKRSRDFSIRFNDAGNPVITVKRKPKYLTKKEILTLCEESGKKESQIWMWLRERKIEIRS